MKIIKVLTTMLITLIPFSSYANNNDAMVEHARQLNPTTVELILNNGKTAILDFYGNNIFRLFHDNAGGIVRDPQAAPPASILSMQPRRRVDNLSISENDDNIAVSTNSINVNVDKKSGMITVTDSRSGKNVISMTKPVEFKRSKFTMVLKETPDEYFYGGGVQNGRFSHRGKKIEIVNTNSWTDGGVASPAPFYWSTNGYGVMFHTFAPGYYDFGATTEGEVTLTHETSYLDVFFMVDEKPEQLLNDYYQLTGNPVLLPKFAFYEGHLNAYNRDYWKETDKGGILFEDNKRYVESQKDNGGVKESLNGENNNYQFSARAVIDRYKNHDMPLGWILPNDGYSAGYGQTNTLEGNIANLKKFGDYARKNGVEVGLWTQSNLHPVDGVSALLQRDIVKEVCDAGVRVLKTDVAWVGYGYSFGLNGIADVAHIMPYYGNNSRPFIISLDGWAGTQRYAAVWTGDQTGGKWEYIRFHIPTYIGSGLSGLGNITSDMDGIFGGDNTTVNIRDFQWKTFTPMQLNMDGWGKNPKYPHILGEPAESINRNYLKLKSMLLPYTYSCSHEAVTGKPLMRAMFLDYPNKYTHGTATQYQYMYGPYFLVAPVFQDTQADKDGNDIRNGIYLPEGRWIDYFNGDVYEGGKIISNYDAPIWKLPIFVKAGAIIPMNNANNNPSQIDKTTRIIEVYPYGNSSFEMYDDDGVSADTACAKTLITSALNDRRAVITVAPTTSSFKGMAKETRTLFIVDMTARPKSVKAAVATETTDKGGKHKTRNMTLKLREVNSEKELMDTENAFFFNPSPNLNRFSTPSTPYAGVEVTKNAQLMVNIGKNNVRTGITLTIDGYEFTKNRTMTKGGKTEAPDGAGVKEGDSTPYTLTPSWNTVGNADYYEIMFDGMVYSTIHDNKLLFTDLQPGTKYDFKVRSVNKDGCSDWSSFQAATSKDPLLWAIRGITGKCSVNDTDADTEMDKLFDFKDRGDIFYARMDKNGAPMQITADLRCITQLDSMLYVPREGGSGCIMNATVETSVDKHNWTPAGKIEWKGGEDSKSFIFTDKPTARFIRLNITRSLRNVVSGRELYVFRMPGAKIMIPGDINQDGIIDDNDLTSYINYTGLKKGDSDFDGYISKGDINGNGIIDALDISEVATRLDGGIATDEATINGEISAEINKLSFNAGDDIAITIKGKSLKAVNAISLILPYKESDMKFVAIEADNLKGMHNMTNDRLHTDGTKVLYPTFVNIGDQQVVNGDITVMTIHFKALRKMRYSLPKVKGMIVDKYLNEKEW